MNIELIKSELEKLTLMLSSWQSEEEVSAIERDIALDKLKSLYDMIRFGAEPSPSIAPTPDVETAEEERESDVEIELLFAEEDEIFTTTPEPIEDTEDEEQTEEATEEQTVAAQSFAAEVLASAIGIDVIQPEVEISEPMPEKEEEEVKSKPETEVEPTPMPTMEPVAPIVEPEPEPEPETEPEPTPEPTPVAEEIQEAVASSDEKEEETPTLNNLFGIEEIKPRPRTKHQRMMSIYDDNPSQHEKVVDISKIFDMDIDAPKPMTSPTIEREVEPEPEPIIIAEHVAEPAPATVYEQEDEEPTMTLADAMANPKQTLADTIVTPTALGDDMNHAKIRSLREGIGLNDKFLMIRDLFDGDNEAYDEAISALDEMESMDDCMIHIIENYAWNPDSEGSKFIMQLLERKLS